MVADSAGRTKQVRMTPSPNCSCRSFRVIYVAKFADAIYVLHCFQKKTQATSKADLDLAASRYRELVKELDK
jgi:phage-related protein